MYIQKISGDAAYSPESQVSTLIKNTGDYMYVRLKKKNQDYPREMYHWLRSTEKQLCNCKIF